MKKLTSLQFSLCVFVGFFSHNGVMRTKLRRNAQGSRKHCQNPVVLSLNWMVWEIQEFQHLVMFLETVHLKKRINVLFLFLYMSRL